MLHLGCVTVTPVAELAFLGRSVVGAPARAPAVGHRLPRLGYPERPDPGLRPRGEGGRLRGRGSLQQTAGWACNA